ncbi:MAG TPA: glucose-6-phosphate dehydrogenase [Terriglobales bacterium]|nr:glucose-6-phosphate dehydrogenase [Terriglobales bacterium]
MASIGAATPVPLDTGTELFGRQAGPCVMVIFGATGDLTARKLIPALYNLAKSKHLSQEFAVVGVARRNISVEQFRASLTEKMKSMTTGPLDQDLWEWVLGRIYYVPGQFHDPQTYTRLRDTLEEVNKAHNTYGNYFFYLAASPEYFGDIITQLGQFKLVCEENHQWRRVIIEKPFGRDLDSAKTLNREIGKVLSEKQIYRIDHYLGKETVQNILIFRFGNGIFEPIWNRRYIDHVQITVAETVGVEQRGGYFDTAGTLRDMVPNHLFQLLTLTAMEPPISFGADSVRSEQTKTLRAIQTFTSEEVIQRCVRGQYGEGKTGEQRVPAYRAEPGVPVDSKTETFVALKLLVDNWRWADVPFYIRTGKRMPRRYSEVAIQFKRPPLLLFRDTPVEKLQPNVLVINIAPDEGISLSFSAKIPGPQVRVGHVDMNFCYSDYFGTTPSTGYEVLLYDCIMGDATLFQSAEMIEAGWSVVDPVLDVWNALPARNFPNYAAGTWGPKEAFDLLERDRRRWQQIDDACPIRRAEVA